MSFEPRERTNDDGLILNAMSRWLLWPVVVTVAAIIGFAFVLSFQSQVDLAIAARIREEVAFGWPIIVDGTIIVSTFAAFILHARRRKSVWYPWATLILFGSLSIWANGIHAIGAVPTQFEMFLVGAVPAVGLLLSTHMLVVMLSPARHEAQDEPAAPVPAPVVSSQPTLSAPVSAQPALVLPAQASEARLSTPAHGGMSSSARPSQATPQPVKKNSTPAKPVQGLSRTDALQLVRDRAAKNTPITAAELAKLMSTSEQRAQILIDQTSTT
ncbi:DUF2637 domain-containing protein [Agromyces humi]|uniref:DUF2637 domain-containing protein n=1 Tax=Agromyces humi TaxID=1766800 RepID=UPI001359888A|nr:DUF2637 domain-containing protein [Agromyces humi]